jgi:hypothetical protein
MKDIITNILVFIYGVILAIVLVIWPVDTRHAVIIKMYTEGKIVCTTLADEFICREVEKE